MSAKTILVTGSDGFIGSHLTEALVRLGHAVRAFVYYNAYNSSGWLDHIDEEAKRNVEIISGDIRDASKVRKAIRGCDLVYHLAALIGIPYSYESPESYVQTNVIGTLNVLEAVRDFSVGKLVHTSTSEVYGTARFVPITEDHPLQAQSPYSASKIAADQIAIAFHNSFLTPVAIIRPFNTYGPRQSTRAVIPTIIVQIAKGIRRIRLGALHPTRDLNYIRDTVRGFLAVGESERSIGEVVNIGTQFEVSIGELVHLVAGVMEVSVAVESDPLRLRPAASEVERLLADNSKAARLVDWRPEYGGLDGLRRGLTETVEWFCRKENLRMYKAEAYTV